MKRNYGFKKEIEQKLFQGIVIPTAEKQGYDIRNHREIANMMMAMSKKYNSMSKDQRKILIKLAENNIQQKIDSINKNENQ